MRKFFIAALSICLGFGALVFLSCVEKHGLPHIPGVYINKGDMEGNKELWKKNKPQNYSYRWTETYKGSYSSNMIANISVEEGEIKKMDFVELGFRKREDYSPDAWQAICDDYKREEENYSIDKLFDDIEDLILLEQNNYNLDPDYYYGYIDLEYSPAYHFIRRSEDFGMSMREEYPAPGSVRSVRIIEISDFMANDLQD